MGFQTALGAVAELGRSGGAVSVSGFYGRNPHAIAGERSDVYGATVRAGYRFGDAAVVQVTPWVGLGGAVHARRSEPYPGLEATRRGVTLDVGATVSRELGRVRAFASAFYTRGAGELGTASFPTELVTLGGGLEIPLRND